MVRGRFAPTPSGPLHMGSLVAALASYLDARRRGGLWLVRIEDVDTTRCKIEFEKAILLELERHGLFWDGQVVRQSKRSEFYVDALSTLAHQNFLYSCSCTRLSLQNRGCEFNAQGELVYPGFCRPKSVAGGRGRVLSSGFAERFLVEMGDFEFLDEIAGFQFGSVAKDVGDFVVRRADGCFSYNLAVVVDDFLQGINRVVRGADILPLTGRHMVLQRALGFAHPQYAHIPLVFGEDGRKLSKSDSARALSETSAPENLKQALAHLGVPIRLSDHASINDILRFAQMHYTLS